MTEINISNCIFSSSDGKYKTYLIPCRFLNKSLFKQWHMNRPSDKERINEIRNYLLDNKPEKIDGEIFAAKIDSEWDKGNCHYEIYDGNHRREAITSGYSQIQPNSKVLLTIVNVKNDVELLDHFRRINKMVPLSEADLVGDPDIQKTLHKIAKDYCDKYPSLVKTTIRPNRPYFNRDEFVDTLYKIYSECNLTNSVKLIKSLDSLNNYIEKTFECLLNDSCKTKTVNGLTISKPMYITANKVGLYIFLTKNIEDEVKHLIELLD
jgi:hypothetical protein